MAGPALGGALYLGVPGRLASAAAGMVVHAGRPAARIQGPAADQVCFGCPSSHHSCYTGFKSCNALLLEFVLSELASSIRCCLCHPKNPCALHDMVRGFASCRCGAASHWWRCCAMASVGSCREEVNMVLEKARQEGFLGASLEAKVLLHVADAQLASSLAALQGVRPFPLRWWLLRIPTTLRGAPHRPCNSSVCCNRVKSGLKASPDDLMCLDHSALHALPEYR